MKDLECLASEHHIESKLHSGDGLEGIYQLLNDNEVTRWLSKLCEETCDHEQWVKLIEFLEKDRIPSEGFESTTTKDFHLREVWGEKE